MQDTLKKKRALLSVKLSETAVEIGKRLDEIGWDIVATRDLARALRASNVPVTDVSDFVGIDEEFPFPPTLHPKMERALTQNGDDRIDLVFDVPYPVTEGNDVGGHTLLGLAAKGDRYAVVSAEDMFKLLDRLSTEGHDKDQGKFRRQLIEKANFKIAGHYMSLLNPDIESPFLTWSMRRERTLASGENPYQSPAYLYRDEGRDELSLACFEQRAGDAPCFTNLADLDSVLETMVRLAHGCLKRFGKIPFIVVSAKHGNPCGLGVSWSDKLGALMNSLWGYPQAIWGVRLC